MFDNLESIKFSDKYCEEMLGFYSLDPLKEPEFLPLPDQMHV